METLNQITAFFARVWEVFSVNHPILDIPFSTIYLGAFAVSFSIIILKPILGVGAGTITDISRSARTTRNQIRNRRQSKYEQSYEAYKARRNRAKEYADRYKRGE